MRAHAVAGRMVTMPDGVTRPFASRRLRRMHALGVAVAVLCCCVLLLGVSGCAPSGSAVGDTRTAATNTTHDSMDRSDITVGVLCAGSAELDSRLLDSSDRAGLKAVYEPCAQGGRPATQAGAGMDDFASRPVSVVLVAALSMAGNASGSGDSKHLQEPQGSGDSAHFKGNSNSAKSDARLWNDALVKARNAGIPVVLVDPVGTLPKRELYAARCHVKNGSATDAQSLASALDPVINNNPHARDMDIKLGKNK